MQLFEKPERTKMLQKYYIKCAKVGILCRTRSCDKDGKMW